MIDLESLAITPEDERLAIELGISNDARLARYVVRGRDQRAGFTWEIFGELTDSAVPMTDMRLVAPPSDPVASRLDIYQVVIRHISSSAFLEWRFSYSNSWDPDPDSTRKHWLSRGELGETALRHVERATNTELRTLLSGRRILGQYAVDPAKAARAAKTMEANRRRLQAATLKAEGKTSSEIADAIGIPADNVDRTRQVRTLVAEARKLGLIEDAAESPD